MLRCECEILVKNAREIKGCHTKNVFTGYYDGRNSDVYFNTSTIVTRLIHEVGRLVDDYASDFMYTWKAIDRCMHDSDWLLAALDRNESNYFPIGLRKSGVDGSATLGNVMDYGNNFYRQIYLVRIDVTGKRYDTMTTFEGDIEVQLMEVDL